MALNPKPIFHAYYIDTNNIKFTPQTQLLHTIFHWLVLGLVLVIIGLRWALFIHVGQYWVTLGAPTVTARLFKYQHVGLGNTTSTCWASKPMQRHQHKWFPVAVEYRPNLPFCYYVAL